MIPYCIHRGKEHSPGEYECNSRHIVHLSGVTPPNYCETCPHPNGTSRGLGDTIHKITHALGIDKLGCDGCTKRMEKLNEAVPYNGQ